MIFYVGDYINTMKTTFESNIDLNLAVKQHCYTKIYKSREFINLKSLSLITCKLIIRKKSVKNQNLNKKVVFIVVI